MPFDNRHAPLDSPRLTGEPMAPTPGVNDNSNRIATTALVQAVARRPPPANPTIQLFGDLRGSGTISINVTVIGIQGRHVTTDPPADTEVYVWSQAAYAWELVPACQLGQQSDGNDLVQVSDGAGGFNGAPTSVVPGTYPGANVTVDRHGMIQRISSGILDPDVIPDAPSDGVTYGRRDGDWAAVTPGGAATQVQYNNGSAFAGSSGATFSATRLTSLAIGLGGDHTGDIWFLNAAGQLTRLPIGLEGQVLQVVNGIPAWVTGATAPPPTGAVWDGGTSIWDGGASVWDGAASTEATWDGGSSTRDS